MLRRASETMYNADVSVIGGRSDEDTMAAQGAMIERWAYRAAWLYASPALCDAYNHRSASIIGAWTPAGVVAA